MYTNSYTGPGLTATNGPTLHRSSRFFRSLNLIYLGHTHRHSQITFVFLWKEMHNYYKRINFPSEYCCHGSTADPHSICVAFNDTCLSNFMLTEDIFFKNSMANSSKRGRDGSKKTVQCFYCETETRLDNLERQNNVQHPGRPAKHKIIIPSNQHTLFQILNKQIYDGEKEAESESQESKSGSQRIK